VVGLDQAEAAVDVLSGHSNVLAPHEYVAIKRRLGEDVGA
jgi:hypothetical protein